MENESVYRNAVRHCWNFGNSKINRSYKTRFSKMFHENVGIKKNRDISDRKLSGVYVYKFQGDIIKIADVWYFEGKNGHFSRHFLNFYFFSIFTFHPNCTVQKVVWWFFRAPGGKWPKSMHHTNQTKIFSLTFLSSWPWMILAWNIFTESLRWYLAVLQTRSLSAY